MQWMRNAIVVAIVSGLVLALAACGNGGAAEPDVVDAWARPGDPGDNSAAYMNISNDSDDDITLIAASSDVARMVEIHESQMEDGTMRMEEVPEIVIESGETVSLEPGGFHVMMMNLEEALEPGDSFSLTLHFDEIDDIELDVPVEEQ